MTNKVGILTLPHNRNYGGMIQSVALSHFLMNMGFETVLLKRKKDMGGKKRLIHAALRVIPFQNIDDIRSREVEQRFHARFLTDHFTAISPEIRSDAEMRASVVAHDLSAVVVGSDQVWRKSYIPGGCIGNFFLDFVIDPAVKRISYAASFGSSGWEDPDDLPKIAALLDRFDAVSVREASAVDHCRNALNCDTAVHVLDPTMLLTREFYARLASPPETGGNQIVLNYLLDDNPAYAAVLTALGTGYRPKRMSSSLPGEQSRADLPQWLGAFQEADFVVTDSFHGTVFAILFEKQFLAIVNHGRGADRFYSLLSQLGLENRMIDGEDTAKVEGLLDAPVDYRDVSGRLAGLRAASTEFLRKALSSK